MNMEEMCYSQEANRIQNSQEWAVRKDGHPDHTTHNPLRNQKGWTATQLGVIFSFPLPGFQHQGLLSKLEQPTAPHIPESAVVLILR